jgi:hypothetical protein
MLVKELIKMLKECNQNDIVWFSANQHLFTVDDVTTELRITGKTVAVIRSKEV